MQQSRLMFGFVGNGGRNAASSSASADSNAADDQVRPLICPHPSNIMEYMVWSDDISYLLRLLAWKSRFDMLA